MGKWGSLCLLTVVLFAALGYTVCRKSEPRPSPPGAVAPVDNTRETGAPAVKTVVDQPTQEAMADLIAKWSSVQALSAKIDTALPNAAGLEGTTKGTGKYDLLKRDGKQLLRMKITNVVKHQKTEEERIVTGEYLDFVHDGDALYRQVQQPRGFKKTTKLHYSPDRVLQIGGSDLFRTLKEKYNLKLKPDETIDGKAVYVMEASATGEKWKALHYFDKATGLRVKQAEYDETGKETFLLMLSEINLEPSFSEGHFAYSLPEGFELIDETTTPP